MLIRILSITLKKSTEKCWHIIIPRKLIQTNLPDLVVPSPLPDLHAHRGGRILRLRRSGPVQRRVERQRRAHQDRRGSDAPASSGKISFMKPERV